MDIVSRTRWGAQYGRGHALTGIVGHVVIHHTAGPGTYRDADAEAREVASIERFHAQVRGWAGIGYSWLVAPSGRAYEGRGWGHVGAHTERHNSSSYGIALLGNGDIEASPPAAWATVRRLIVQGIRVGRITPRPRVTGHRDHAATACPGSHNYRLIDQLDGITGTGALEDDMPLSERDLDRLEGMIRRIHGEAVGPGQTTWPGTVYATLHGLQETYNHAFRADERAGEALEQLAVVRRELAAIRAGLAPTTGQAGQTVQLPPRPDPRQ